MAGVAWSAPYSPGRLWTDRLVFAGMVFIFMWHALTRGTDVNWDLLNYHQYNPFALLNKPFGFDIVPAQLQTFLSPVLDVPYYGLRVALNDWPRLLVCLLAVPQALATFLAYRITRRSIPDAVSYRNALALLAVALGASGVASLPYGATTQSDMIPTCFLFGSMLLVLGDLDRKKCSSASMLAAGLMSGIAFGLKLTLLPYCVALAVAIGVVSGPGLIRRMVSLVVFSVAAVVGGLLVGGPWWWKLFQVYGNPIFPYYNTIFHSPFYADVRYTDDRFKPANLVQALFYPFFWGTRRQNLVQEVIFRDPRFLLSYLSVLCAVLASLLVRVGCFTARPRLDRGGWCLLLFFVTGFTLWEIQFSILRYLAPLELLIGTILLLALRPLFTNDERGLIPHAIVIVITIISFGVTVYPQTDFVRFGKVTAYAALPPLESDSLVILLDSSPMSFIASFAPPTVRFVGANNNLVHPGLKVRLQDEIDTVVRNQAGPIWGLEDKNDDGGGADTTLAYYGLRRAEDCFPVESNLNHSSTKLCRLYRANS